MKKIVEKVKVNELILEKIFNKEFLDELNKENETFPVNVTLVREIEKDKDKKIEQIQLFRETSIEKKENILHLESNEEYLINELIEKLK